MVAVGMGWLVGMEGGVFLCTTLGNENNLNCGNVDGNFPKITEKG